jgi:hypothetical protein
MPRASGCTSYVYFLKKMSYIEGIFFNGMLTYPIVIPTIGDGACLSVKFHFFCLILKKAAKRSEIQLFRKSLIFGITLLLSYNLNDGNFSAAEDYVREMVNPTVHGGYCELIAAGNIFPFFFFENYYNNNLCAKFGIDTFPVKI